MGSLERGWAKKRPAQVFRLELVKESSNMEVLKFPGETTSPKSWWSKVHSFHWKCPKWAHSRMESNG